MKVRLLITQSIDDEYIVFGQITQDGFSYFLIQENEAEIPQLKLASLYEITEPSVPNQWYFDYKVENNVVYCRWGFYEFVFQKDYIEKLKLGNKRELDIFEKRKLEILDFYNHIDQYVNI